MKIHTLLNDTAHPKNSQLRLDILKVIIDHGAITTTDLSRHISLSIPTISKMINEMVSYGLLYECGKADNQGSRKASLYDINKLAGYFVGVDIQQNQITCILTDFSGNLLVEKHYEYVLENTKGAYDEMIHIIDQFLGLLAISLDKILTLGICLPGRINSGTGISYSFFHSETESFTGRMEARFGLPVLVENDTRSAAYGEFICGVGRCTENLVYVNISWGLGIGIITGKQIYYGKSGYSGEYGHLPVFDNEILCHCGKKGCLETEASGSAIVRRFKQEYAKGSNTVLKNKMNLNDPSLLTEILQAAKEEDLLSLDSIDYTGRILGKFIAGLLNIFNPELLILGGEVGTLGKQISLPIETGIMKHSLNFVNSDTEIRISSLKQRAGCIGICMLARNTILGIIKH